MKKFSAVVALLAGVLLVGSAAQGLVIDPNYGSDYKAYANLRKDMGKQTAKLTSCLTKALVKCIDGSDPNNTTLTWPAQCNATNPDASLTNADTKAAWKAAVDKCVSKVDLSKKNPASPLLGYQGVGCPAEDPNVVSADLTAYQTKSVLDTRGSIDTVAAQVPSLCAGVGGALAGEALKDCIYNVGKAAEKTIKGVFKCQEKCENELAVAPGKKGGGGLTDSYDPCSAGTPPDGSPVKTCIEKAMANGQKLADKDTAAGDTWAFAASLALQPVDDSTNDLYNECRCSPAAGTPCEGWVPVLP
jgi:hypothetical protein